MDFAEKVRNLLRAHGLSQSDLAEALGTNQQQVSRWLEANTPPKWSYLLKMARTLDVTTDYLIDNSLDEMPRPQSLPEDETAILRLYRSLKRTGALDEDAALTGLAAAAGRQVWIPGSVRDQTPLLNPKPPARHRRSDYPDAVGGTLGQPEDEDERKPKRKRG
jgi:transcriptional regulator with XRE-family HTH domain